MIRFLIYYFAFAITLVPINAAIPQPTQLIPCEKVFELSPHNRVFYHHFSKHFRNNVHLENKEPFFTMFIFPAFDPESVVLVYKTLDSKFFVENYSTRESIWRSLNIQADEIYSDLRKVPDDATFTLPSFYSKGRKQISAKAAHILKRAIDFAVEQSRLNPDELKTGKTYLDGTIYLFRTLDNKCGWPFHELKPGPAEQLLTVEDLLEKYLSGQAKEDEIINSAMKVFENKEK